MSDKSVSYEQSVKRLEEIVRALERGDVSLDESLKLFQEGTQLVQRCTKLLDQAELEIVKLSKGADGAPVESEFEDGVD